MQNHNAQWYAQIQKHTTRLLDYSHLPISHFCMLVWAQKKQKRNTKKTQSRAVNLFEFVENPSYTVLSCTFWFLTYGFVVYYGYGMVFVRAHYIAYFYSVNVYNRIRIIWMGIWIQICKRQGFCMKFLKSQGTLSYYNLNQGHLLYLYKNIHMCRVILRIYVLALYTSGIYSWWYLYVYLFTESFHYIEIVYYM